MVRIEAAAGATGRPMQLAIIHIYRSHKQSETTINNGSDGGRRWCHRPTDAAGHQSSPQIAQAIGNNNQQWLIWRRGRRRCHRPTDAAGHHTSLPIAQAIRNNNQQWFGWRPPLVPQADLCSWPSIIATDRTSDVKQQSTMVRIEAAAGATGRPMQQAINHRHQSHKQPSHDSMDDRSEASTIALM
jgi:hypothetical protein